MVAERAGSCPWRSADCSPRRAVHALKTYAPDNTGAQAEPEPEPERRWPPTPGGPGEGQTNVDTRRQRQERGHDAGETSPDYAKRNRHGISQKRNDLCPDGNHAPEQRQRRQGGSFLDQSSEHHHLPVHFLMEQKKNIVLALFFCQACRSSVTCGALPRRVRTARAPESTWPVRA